MMNQEEEFKYWCYNCQQSFKQVTNVEICNFCQSPAIQLTSETAEDPSTFQAYQIEANNSQLNPPQNNANLVEVQTSEVLNFGPFQLNFSQTTIRNPNQPNPLQMSFNIGQMMETMNSIMERSGLNQLLSSLIGEPNLVPASSADMARLEQVDRVQECSVCQEEGSEAKGYKLQCGHKFHIECLTPWFQRTNTCPTCRQRI